MQLLFRLLVLCLLVSACSETTPPPKVKPVSIPPSKPSSSPVTVSPPKTQPPPITTPSKKQENYYIVVSGDTLYSIGIRTGIGHKKLAEWNDIGSDFKIGVGQRLKLFKSSGKAAAITGERFPLIPFKDDIKGVAPTREKPKTEPAANSNKSSEKQNAVADSSVKMPKLGNKKPVNSVNSKKNLKLDWDWPLRGRILKSFANTGKKGIDIEAESGSKVLAAADGEVVYSGSGVLGYGQLLIIKHDSSFLSAYANNEALLVKEGQVVMQGQEVARSGNNKNGRPTLHFEIRKKGKAVNPTQYLPAR